MVNAPLASVDTEFARVAGDVAESFNFNKSVGQIYGLLYLSPSPVSLNDMCERLSMSKGNASINIRMLESWGAVRPVSVVGSRKDYYEANRDIKAIAMRRLQEGLTKRIDRAEEQLNRLAHGANGSLTPVQTKQIQDLQSLLNKGRRAMKFIAQWIA